MSGHSHFKTIKAHKEVADAKRGKIFAKIGKVISLAAKDGPDPAVNSKLRTVIEQAKIANMPKDNIEKAIKRGSGELDGSSLEEVSFEGFGPGGTALIVGGITDNKNRTLADVKQIFNRYDAKLAGEGAVRWMFERRGIILIEEISLPKEEAELIAIEAGAEDIAWQTGGLEIYTQPLELENVKKTLEEKSLKIASSFLGWVPKESIDIDQKAKEKNEKMFEALDENDAIQEIFSNIK
ncbi:YebC/PmpR family DNA-binding transcriptional regulator [Patescibacteria group bacterium]|nr:YebC/PmpR family DNA-binding transcriptional regulator [Patescibacteria group bacterium]